MSKKTITLTLNDSAIKKYKSDPEIRELNDVKSSVRFRYLTDRGKGSFFRVTSVKGKARWVKFASYPDCSAKMARGNVGNHSFTGSIEKHKTVGDVLSAYLIDVDSSTRVKEENKRTIRSLMKWLKPLNNIKLSDMTNNTFKSLVVHSMEARGLAISYIQQVFKRLLAALEKEKGMYISDTPSNLKWKKIKSDKIESKGAQLTAGDWAYLVELSDGLKVTARAKSLFYFMLLHGTRIGETRQLSWRMVDFRTKVIRLPKEITKTSVPLYIPMTEHVEAFLLEYKQVCSDSAFLFSSRSGFPISANTAYKDIRSVVDSGDYYFNAHDLRKLFSSTIGEKNFGDEAREMLLNHSLGKLHKVYNSYEGMEKKKRTITLYHDYLKKEYGFKFVTKTMARRGIEALANSARNDRR